MPGPWFRFEGLKARLGYGLIKGRVGEAILLAVLCTVSTWATGIESAATRASGTDVLVV